MRYLSKLRRRFFTRLRGSMANAVAVCAAAVCSAAMLVCATPALAQTITSAPLHMPQARSGAETLQVAQPPPSICTRSGVLGDITVNALRQHLMGCTDETIHLVGVARINAAELPVPGQQFRFRPVAAAPTEDVTYDVDLFFYPGETYLPDPGFERLDRLIQILSQKSSQIISISLVGRGDLWEMSLGMPVNSGLERARHVLKYLHKAGLPETTPVALVQAFAAVYDGPDMQARNRAVRVNVRATKAATVDAASALATSASSGALSKPGNQVSAGTVLNADQAYGVAMGTRERARKPLRTELETQDEAIRKELARLKWRLRDQLQDALRPLGREGSLRLLVEVNEMGIVEQAWVMESKGPIELAQKAMAAVLSKSSLGPFPKELQANAQRLILSAGWSSEPPSTLGAPAAEYLFRPSYPAQAKRLGQQGRVELRVQALPDGRSGEIEVVKSSGHALLDDAAKLALRRTYFLPTNAVEPTYHTIPIGFVLE